MNDVEEQLMSMKRNKIRNLQEQLEELKTVALEMKDIIFEGLDDYWEDNNRERVSKTLKQLDEMMRYI